MPTAVERGNRLGREKSPEGVVSTRRLTLINYHE